MWLESLKGRLASHQRSPAVRQQHRCLGRASIAVYRHTTVVSETVTGIVFGLVASMGWAIANVYIQRSARVMGAFRSMFWGQLVGALLLLPFMVVWPVGAEAIPYGWLLIGGAASAIAYFTLFKSFAGGPVSIISPIVSGWAVVSCLLGILLFGESVSALRTVGIVAVVGGMAAIGTVRTGADGDAGWTAPRAHVLCWAVLCSLGFGVMVASFEPLGKALGRVGSLLGVWLMQWVFLLPVVWTKRHASALPPEPSRRGTWMLIAAVGGFEVVGFLGLEAGLRHAPLVVVSPVASTSALMTVLIGRFFLDEHVPLRVIGLAVIVATGVVMLGLG